MNAPLVTVRPLDATALLGGMPVVEISGGVAGAYCGWMLARLGARVSRFPGETTVVATADAARLMQRFFHGPKDELPADPECLDTALAQARIVVVDALDPGHRFARRVRSLIERRAGLRPDAVLVVLSANGLPGDLSAPGCALTSAAGSGMSFSIGNRSEEPLTLPCDIADTQCGINGVAAALAGILRGEANAGPIDVASRDVLANLVGTLAHNYVPYGRPWRREGTRPSMSGGVYPCGLFPCKDGFVAIYCRGTQEWRGIVDAMGNPPWSAETRFLDPKVVATLHADEADSHLIPWLRGFTRAELTELGSRFGFPAAPVRYVREALADAQFAFRGSFEPIERDDGGEPIRIPAPPWRLFEASVAGGTAVRPPDRPRTSLGAVTPARILAGLRVLDFSWVWSGPMAASILADLGAEVIKVEHPSRLDSLRQRGKPRRHGVEIEGPAAEANPWFNQLNHGKKSIVADIKSVADQAKLRQLAASCDVVVENMRPGALAGCGLGYADLAAGNAGLVMLSMSMAGQTGPLSRMKGYAGIMTSMAGLESIVGYASAEADATFVGMTQTAMGDPNGAAHGVAVLLAALHRRRETGRGAWIDLAQTDAILSIMAAPVIECQLTGHVPVRGNSHPEYVPHGHFPCRGDDRWVALSVQDDRQWSGLARVVGGVLAPLAGLDSAGRRARRTEIDAALRTWTRARVPEEIASLLDPICVPCSAVASFEAMLASDWKARRGISRVVEHPVLGHQEIFVVPWHFDGITAGVAAPAPLLGEHTVEILGNPGMPRDTQPEGRESAAAPAGGSGDRRP